MSNNGNFALGMFANLGVPSGAWTLGLMIMSQLLWPTELKVHMAGDEGNDPSSFGSKPNVSTCPLIPNIKTALFIQLAATSTVYEDYERNFMPTSFKYIFIRPLRPFSWQFSYTHQAVDYICPLVYPSV